MAVPAGGSIIAGDVKRAKPEGCIQTEMMEPRAAATMDYFYIFPACLNKWMPPSYVL